MPPPGISSSLPSVVFGTHTVGHTSSVQVVTLTNSGGSPLSTLLYATTGDFAIPSGDSTCMPTLAVGASGQIGLVFTPTQPGQRTAWLTVTAAELGKPLAVSLSGTGVPASGISATPTSINFGSYAVGQTSPTKFVTLTNNGGVQLTHLGSAVRISLCLGAEAPAGPRWRLAHSNRWEWPSSPTRDCSPAHSR